MKFLSLMAANLQHSENRAEVLASNLLNPGVALRMAPTMGFSRKFGREFSSESCSENALAFREWPFHSESFFLLEGVVPRFVKILLCLVMSKAAATLKSKSSFVQNISRGWT